MKQYVLVLLFNNEMDKVLLMQRKRKPYINLYNGIGGKIENNETVEECAIRETFEETEIKLVAPKFVVLHKYSENIDFANNNIELNVLYDIVDQQEVKENEEGTFEWKEIDFALDFNNKMLAGYGNVALFIREILQIEKRSEFYS